METTAKTENLSFPERTLVTRKNIGGDQVETSTKKTVKNDIF
jgi:hypothetical protein